MRSRLPWLTRGLIGAFAISGALHLAKPELFQRIMPRVLPNPRELIVVSGVAEVGGAIGLAIPATRRLAGPLSAALLVAILPANIQGAYDAVRSVVRRGITPKRLAVAIIAVVRVPLQWPLITAAWRAGRR